MRARQLFSAPNHKAISPTVAPGPDGFNRIFYVDAGASGCTATSSVVKMRIATTDTASLGTIAFGDEVKVDLAQPGYVIWHIKIRYVAALKQYIAMYAAFPMTTGIGDCTETTTCSWRRVRTTGTGTRSPRRCSTTFDRRFNFITLYRASFQYEPKTATLRTIVVGARRRGLGPDLESCTIIRRSSAR